MEKCKLVFITKDGKEFKFNKGKSFKMPNWTVDKHEAALDRLLKETEGLSEDEKDKEFKYFVIYETLSRIDDKVTLYQIRNMHPDDLAQLFREVYYAGKRGIYESDFREGEKTNLPNSTTKKN